jgi:sterol desaturase/sphingolipid hydroxylase (fatty acid hydroxylase superfamily)
MTLPDLLLSSGKTIAIISGAMAAAALIETLAPLHARRLDGAHLRANLTLTAITFITNVVFNLPLAAGLVWAQATGFGLLNQVALPTWAAFAVMVVVMDFWVYVTHVCLHKVPLFWRFHRVHHSDPAVDVTTQIRQHPGEGLIRYSFLAVAAIPLGAPPALFAVYRLMGALFSTLEHANIGAPQWLDSALSLVTTWPNLHKVHHSRHRAQTDSNYSNLLSVWDRLFGTFTPSRVGQDIDYGLAGFDAPEQQTALALLAAPFHGGSAREPQPAKPERAAGAAI